MITLISNTPTTVDTLVLFKYKSMSVTRGRVRASRRVRVRVCKWPRGAPYIIWNAAVSNAAVVF